MAVRGFSQGDLDSLCGVYAVINSVKSMLGKKWLDAYKSELASHLTEVLESEGKLRAAVSGEGIRVRLLGRLIDAASHFLEAKSEIRITRRMAATRSHVPLEVFWQTITNHHEEHSSGSVILCLYGKHDHWSCLESISPGTIRLIDSNGLKQLNRANCTTVTARESGRIHQIIPNQAFLLSIWAED